MVVALVLVDIQYDFLSGGSLAVPDGDTILPLVRKLMSGKWDWVVASQDFHPPGHVSFASTHSMEPFTSKTITIPYQTNEDGSPSAIEQMLWPDHCVQHTRGAFIEESIRSELNKWFDKGRGIVIQKGKDKLVDAYSAFASSPPVPPRSSPLSQELYSHNIATLFVVGLATDYCVKMTSMDARKAGFEVFVIDEAVRAVGGNEARNKVYEEFKEAGVKVVSVEDGKVKEYL